MGIMLKDVNIALCCIYTPGRLRLITANRYAEMLELHDRLKCMWEHEHLRIFHTRDKGENNER